MEKITQEQESNDVETLKTEFFNQYWTSVTDTLTQQIKKLSSASLQQRLEKRMPGILDLERRFVQNVIEHFVRWNKEKTRVVVFWDIHATIGDVNDRVHKFGFRPAFLGLAKFLKEKFPDIKNGILSTWLNVAPELNSGESLERASFFFDREFLLSSSDFTNLDAPAAISFVAKTTEQLEKLGIIDGETKLESFKNGKIKVLADLKGKGINPKVVDDDEYAVALGQDALCLHPMRGVKAAAIDDFCF